MTAPNLHVQFTSFDGPLDLLLSLIDERKMEISEVSISSVTEKFLEYLESLDETDALELADFLVIASKLLLLKSKTLLASVEPEEDEGTPLEEQLRRYRELVRISKILNTRWEKNQVGYERIEPPRIPEIIPLPENLSTDALVASLRTLLDRIKPPKALPQTHIDRSISLKETIARLRELVISEKRGSFFQYLSEKASKTEIIVSFLAVLELVKQKEINIHQEKVFSDIAIHKT